MAEIEPTQEHQGDCITTAPRTWRIAAGMARVLLWLVVFLWAVFALTWGALHFWIVPRADQWRPDIERWASNALGVPVHIGKIEAVSEPAPHEWLPSFVPSLVPRVAFKDIRLSDEAGREALHLPMVEAALSVHSVWRLGFEQLRIQAPVLDIRRLADGSIEVAGLRLGQKTEGNTDDTRVSNWFFHQGEFLIEKGVVRWTDESIQQPTLVLSDVDLVIRNTSRKHDVRLDATPPAEWGQRFSLVGKFREPLLDLSRVGRQKQQPWMRWEGQGYADFTQVDVTRLHGYVDLSRWKLRVNSGQGALRAWADIKRGAVLGATADVNLQDVSIRLGDDLQDLALAQVSGRLAAVWSDTGYKISTPDLRFRTQAGETWPGGSLSFEQQSPANQPVVRMVSADAIDLAAMANVATRLPLPSSLRDELTSLQPRGRVKGVVGQWTEAADGSVPQYQFRGQAENLYLNAQPSSERSDDGSRALPGRPGISNAKVEFRVDQNGGTATLAVANGAMDLPGVFEVSEVPLGQLDAALHWTIQGDRINVDLDQLSLSNDDAQGTAKASWHTHDSHGQRFPGVLDLTATLTRADATKVYRYMPLSTGVEARAYVQGAVQQGSADKVEFRVKGNVNDVPYDIAGKTGTFRITAALKNLDFDYVPPHVRDEGSLPWPVLHSATAQLELQGNRLTISDITSGVVGLDQLRLTQGSVRLPDLVAASPKVEVDARLAGPGEQVLQMVKGSPLNSLTSEALAKATLSGVVQSAFRLSIPLNKAEDTKVSGDVQLKGNNVRITPESPMLADAAGDVKFSETGFEVSNASAQVYGGRASFSGGMKPSGTGSGESVTRFTGSGTATAEGIARGELGFVSRLFSTAQGSARYNVKLGFKAGVPEIDVDTDLQGMAVNLPAPLSKSAAETLPVRYSNTVGTVVSDAAGAVALNDRMNIDIGSAAAPLARIRFVRDLRGAEAIVRRGSMAIGLQAGEEAPLPDAGVLANMRFGTLDVDAWEKVFNATTGVDVRQAVKAQAVDDSAGDASLGYLPTVMAVRADTINFDGRSFHNVVVGGAREGALWKANIDSRELNGYVELRQPKGDFAGSVYARLARLELSKTDTSNVEELLQQPSSVPALDIAVENLQVVDKNLGRVEIEAVNQGIAARVRQWQLKRLSVILPEATLTGTGAWAPPLSANGGQRQATLDFALDIKDSGALLTHFGKAGTVRGGRGKISGNIAWLGSPFKVDYPTMSGKLRADIERGQFLKVDPGAAKLLGVLSLQSLPRRLFLDFRDVFSDGFAFDSVRGDATISEGVISTRNLQMRGVNAAVLMEGTADIAREQQNLKVVVVPEINAGTASLLAATVNPVVGLGTFLAQLILREPLQSANTQVFQITGSWSDPQVTKVERPKPAAPATPATPAAPATPAVPPASTPAAPATSDNAATPAQ